MRLPDRFECVIEKVVFGGDGFTRAPDGTALFVPRTLPGEVVIAEIAERKRDYARARVLNIVSPSPERCEQQCPLYGRCAGCDYAHMSYAEELKVKNAQLLDQMTPLFPQAAVLIGPPAASPERFGYRNKLVLHTHKAGKIFRLGYVGDDNVSVVDVDQCFLAHPAINALLAERRADPGFVHTLHDGMRLTLRFESASDRVHLFRNSPDPKASWLREEMPFGSFSTPLGSFFQVNPAVAAILAEDFSGLVRQIRPQLLLDLYCGSGFFSCAAASGGVTETLGVEIDAAACAAAGFNLKRYPGCRSRFVSGDAAKALRGLLHGLPEATLAVVDPPRGGLAAEASSALCSSPLKDLCYISCNASTLARDAAKLKKHGFELRKLRLFDMFPCTRHFETTAFFSR